MKKNKGLVLAIIFCIVSFATTVFAAVTASGNFSLSYGQYNRSSYAKLEASYPYVIYNAQKSDSTMLRVTLSKKGFLGLGFDNVQVKEVPLNASQTSYAYFSQQTKNKEYLITTVNNNAGTIANSKYTLTSKSTFG